MALIAKFTLQIAFVIFSVVVGDAIWLQKAFNSAAGFILHVVNTDHVVIAKTTVTHSITKLNLSTLILAKQMNSDRMFSFCNSGGTQDRQALPIAENTITQNVESRSGLECIQVSTGSVKVAPYCFLTARELVSKSRDGASFQKSTRKLRPTSTTASNLHWSSIG